MSCLVESRCMIPSYLYPFNSRVLKQQFLFCCQGNLKLRSCPWSKLKFWIDFLFGQSSLNELLSLGFHFKRAKKKKKKPYQDVCHIRDDLTLLKIFAQLLRCTYIPFYPCFWFITPASFIFPNHTTPSQDEPGFEILYFCPLKW